MNKRAGIGGWLAGCSVAALVLLNSMAVAAEPASRWAATMTSRRAALEGSVNAQHSPWQTCGDLKAETFSTPLWPEQGVDLKAKGPDKRPLWKPLKGYKDGVTFPLGARDKTATYLYRTITSTSPGPLRVGLGSDDGIEVWLNGKKVHSNNAARGVAPDSDVLTLNLAPGTNALLVKVYNQTGDSGFYYAAGSSSPGVLAQVGQSFPAEVQLFKTYFPRSDAWIRSSDNAQLEQNAIKQLLGRLKDNQDGQSKLAALVAANTPADNPAWLDLFLQLAREVEQFDRTIEELSRMNLPALRLAVEDLTRNFPDTYRQGSEFLRAIATLEKDLPKLVERLKRGESEALRPAREYTALQRRALLANPLLDFDRVLLIKRHESNLGLPQNWQGNSSINPNMDNSLVTLSIKNPDAPLKSFYKPERNVFVGDVDLHFDADRMLFSSIGTHNRWQVFELNADGSGLRQVSPSDEKDIDSYDPMYLPDGRIIYASSSTFQGVPCVGGSDFVANLHIMNPDGTAIRRLCYDQDNDWCPTMLPNGRVLYLRWEYTDSAHYFSRVLMSMNPDGTGQSEFYGSSSYWPNSLFYARPLPGSGSKFVGIVSGHHGVARMGELVVFDAAKGRQEDAGAIQRIPGWGKPVKGIIKDSLVDGSWPKFLHPYPLNEKYYLVSCKPTPSSPWGIYLVDVFDNMLPLREEPGYALFEPLPLQPTPKPPVIVDKIKPGDAYASVYLHNIYMGDGLRHVPAGTVKNLRVFQYEYSYRNMGGHYYIAIEGGWDVRRIIGTVPVNEDGSAMFKIPANTPVAIQPLDAEGKALQQMRSWFVGMPGEVVSCVGCHERQNSSATMKVASAARVLPEPPQPWLGPKRGFSFLREVQPVLDKHCSGCHNGQANRPNLADTNLVRNSILPVPRSYLDLHPYVRRNGPEGDYHTLTPLEFHADTSLVIQMLRKGHHNVKLDPESYDRLITWIDLNVPTYGAFKEIHSIPSDFEKRRYECKVKYANVHEDIETLPPLPPRTPFIKPTPAPERPEPLTVDGWPIAPEKAAQMQAALGKGDLRLELDSGLYIVLKRVPAGTFAMGDVTGDANEFPMAPVRIDKPFWIATTEISLRQFQAFDPVHKNGYYDMHYKDQVRPGYPMDFPDKPAIRVSWDQAMGFCRWLSARTGKRVTLPTEAQWEWACRAGSSSPMFYGNLDSDFGAFANLSDVTAKQFAVIGVDPQPIPNPDKYYDYVLKDDRFNDGQLHLANVGAYKPNVWGLHDMIGNVAEWTLDDYRPYPYKTAQPTPGARKVVRGGSWAERPRESRAASRLDYPSWQRVYNVGFRIVVLDGADGMAQQSAPKSTPQKGS